MMDVCLMYWIFVNVNGRNLSGKCGKGRVGV